MSDKKISIPTVHMNGTSDDALLGQAIKAYYALEDAEQALYDMTPNDRDYYQQGDGAGDEARLGNTYSDFKRSGTSEPNWRRSPAVSRTRSNAKPKV